MVLGGSDGALEAWAVAEDGSWRVGSGRRAGRLRGHGRAPGAPLVEQAGLCGRLLRGSRPCPVRRPCQIPFGDGPREPRPSPTGRRRAGVFR